MFGWLHRLKHYFDPPQDGRVAYQYYVRTGDCNGCGQCCSGIHLIHGDTVIETVEMFDRLQQRHEDYRHFIPISETETGVVFRCRNLLPDNRCGIYDDRPLFCKKYPTETTLLMGGVLSPECSYLFSIREHFQTVLGRTAEQKRLKPGKLLNDVPPTPRIDSPGDVAAI